VASGFSAPISGFESWHGTLCCVVLKTFNSHSASLHPGVKLGTSEFNARGHLCKGLSHLGGSRNTPSRFIPQKEVIGAGLMGHLACICRLNLYLSRQS